MKDKDAGSILRTLAPLADHIILTKPHTDRATPPSLLKKVLGQNGKKAEIGEDFEEAIERGLSMTGEKDLFGILDGYQ
jgi:folylpolyglutamate synthase/dihydropteroate synthase